MHAHACIHIHIYLSVLVSDHGSGSVKQALLQFTHPPLMYTMTAVFHCFPCTFIYSRKAEHAYTQKLFQMILRVWYKQH